MTIHPSRARTLEGVKVVSLAVNVPGPVACFELAKLGAQVTKIEPPAGDPLGGYCADWYRALAVGQSVLTLDLKTKPGIARLQDFLRSADILVSATRPEALDRLGLGWKHLSGNFPRLIQIAITGYPAPDENLPGHDLTYQARAGLLDRPPRLPRTLLADLAAAQQAVSRSLAALLDRQKTGAGQYVPVAISEACASFAAPYRHGLTREDGPLGGAHAGYQVCETKEGWIAVAALEEHFFRGLLGCLRLESATGEDLRKAFLSKTAGEWEALAVRENLPLAAIPLEIKIGENRREDKCS